MTNKTKFVLNRSGVKALMQSNEMINVLDGYAQKAASKLGSGYEVSTMVGKTRANARIAAVTTEAIKENSENNTLLKAVGV